MFKYEECQIEAAFVFYENDRIEASIKCDKLDINKEHRFHLYNLSDEQLHDDISSTPVFFETWGEVNLVSATSDSRHSVPEFYITNSDGSLVSYDSERRTGTRENRGLPANDSMITEYRDTYAEYMWRSVSPDILLNKSYPDEKLRAAVGEEYYDKINGVFYNIYLGWQQFYTLEGDEKLIMHSMLTGQNFILER